MLWRRAFVRCGGRGLHARSLSGTCTTTADAQRGALGDVGQQLDRASAERGEDVERWLQATHEDPALEPLPRARAAMMLHQLHHRHGRHRQALHASLAAKAAAEEALGSPQTLEYAAALHAQSQSLQQLGQHRDAARLLSYGAGLVAPASSVLAVRFRHQAAWLLAMAGHFDAAMHELRDLRNHLERSEGAGHVACAITTANLARVQLLSATGAPDAVSATLQDAFHALNAHLGRSHPFARQAYHLWAVCEVQLPPAEQILDELRTNLPV